jgi:hypothetical protein
MEGSTPANRRKLFSRECWFATVQSEQPRSRNALCNRKMSSRANSSTNVFRHTSINSVVTSSACSAASLAFRFSASANRDQQPGADMSSSLPRRSWRQRCQLKTDRELLSPMRSDRLQYIANSRSLMRRIPAPEVARNSLTGSDQLWRTPQLD